MLSAIFSIRFFMVLVIVVLGGMSCAVVEIRVDSNTGKVIRDRLKNGKLAPEMVWIPAGSFYMGAEYSDGEDDEYPSHAVDITRAFAMAKYETTVAEFREFIDATGYLTQPEKEQGCRAYDKWWYTHAQANWKTPMYEQRENYPVVCISWNDAVAYVRWLSEQTGKRYRLPTEAEWEYVVRGGTQTKYWWGNKGDCKQARCNAFKAQWLKKQSNAVGSYKANPFGIHDMTGNVWEWTASEYVTPYDGSELIESKNPPDKGRRTMRGGSWYNKHIDLRSSNRATRPPNEGWSTVGFRVLREK